LITAAAALAAAALSASPAHLTLVGDAGRSVRVTNPGPVPLSVTIGAAGLALGVRGKPRPTAGGSGAASWLRVRPRDLALRPGETRTVSVAARPGAGARPGDHAAVVLLATEPPVRGGVSIRIRIGVVVVVRVPGPGLVRRLELRGLRVRHIGHARVLELLLVNRGDVAERLRRRRVLVTLVRGGRVFTRLRGAERILLPHSRGLDDVAYGGSVRGPITALVEIASPRPGVAMLRRSFRLRL